MTLFETLRGNASQSTYKPPYRPRSRIFAAERTAGDLLVELRPLRSCIEIESQWRDLSRRSLEPNVFVDAEFALAAAQHLIGGDSLSAILIWDHRQDSPRLMAMLPVVLPERRLFAGKLKGIDNHYDGSGAPLVDRARADDVLTRLVDWLATDAAPAPRLILPRIDPTGPFAKAILAVLKKRRLAPVLSSHPPRAAVLAASTGDVAGSGNSTRLKRLTRALARDGKPAVISARSGSALRDAVEIHLAMEASGERGRDGTAMMLRTRTGAFLRAATRGLGQIGQCEILTLMLGERPIATAILYRSGSRASLVHLAVDELYAGFSPAEILLLTIAERQRKDRRAKPLTVTECRVVSQTALVDRTWPDRVVLADIAFDASRPAAILRSGDRNMTFARRTGRYLTRLVRQRLA